MKRVAGHLLVAVAFVVNIPLQAGIAICGLVYAVRAFTDHEILAGITAISMAAVCVAIVHFAVRLALPSLKRRTTVLLNETDVQATSRDQREWERKQVERGYFEGKRSILDAEVRHIKDSLGDIAGTDLSRTRQERR